MGFLDEHVASLEPSTGIPDGVRLTIIQWFEKRLGKGAAEASLKNRHGYATADFALQDIRKRFGEEAADRVAASKEEREAYLAQVNGLRGVLKRPPVSLPPQLLSAALLAGPDALFLDVVEDLAQQEFQRQLRDDLAEEVDSDVPVRFVNTLFKNRGLPYALWYDNWEYVVKWTDEPKSRKVIIGPALEALGHEGFQGSRDEFEAALKHFRAGDPKSLEDAVEEAAKAVESAMKVVLDARAPGRRAEKDTAQPLIDHLVSAGICPREVKSVLMAAAQIRNGFGGHGAGATARAIPPELALLTIRSSATALVYLISLY